jgi:hypothetical protein
VRRDAAMDRTEDLNVKICEKAIITSGASQSERRKGIATGDI